MLKRTKLVRPVSLFLVGIAIVLVGMHVRPARRYHTDFSSGLHRYPLVIAHADDTGLQVHVWTINDPAEMRRLIDMEVDGIMTDRPDVLLALPRRPSWLPSTGRTGICATLWR